MKITRKLRLRGIQLPDKYKLNFKVASEDSLMIFQKI